MLLLVLLMIIFCVPDGLSIKINTFSEEEFKNITDLKASPKLIQLIQVEFSGDVDEDIDRTGIFSINNLKFVCTLFYGPNRVLL